MPEENVSPKRVAGKGRGRRPFTHEHVAEQFRLNGCELLGTYQRNDTPVLFRCHCGRTSTTTWSKFKRLKGCMQCSRPPRGGGGEYRHSRTHLSWMNMLQRCYNPKSEKFPSYGARGITVCQRWRDSFLNFLEDMGEAPPGMTIDRVDNDGDYEAGNCRWATLKQQGRNRRNNRYITANGVTMTLAEWAEKTGIPNFRIQQRIDVQGWTPERAVSTPARKEV